MKKRAIGLEFDDQGMYLAQLIHDQGKNRLEHWEMAELPPGLIVAGKVLDEKALLEVVSSRLGKLAKQTIPIIVGISGVQAFIRKLQIPVVPDKELEQLIHWEGENILPYPITGVFYGYQILRQTGAEYQILFTAVHKEWVQAYLNIFQQLRLPVNHLTLQPFGLVNYLSEGGIPTNYTGVLVRFRSRTVDLVLLYQGELELVRTALFPEELNLIDEKLEFFQQELFQTLGYFQSIYDLWINSGLFFGNREMMLRVRALLPTFHWRHLYLSDLSSDQVTDIVDPQVAYELPATWGLGVLGVAK